VFFARSDWLFKLAKVSDWLFKLAKVSDWLFKLAKASDWLFKLAKVSAIHHSAMFWISPASFCSFLRKK